MSSINPRTPLPISVYEVEDTDNNLKELQSIIDKRVKTLKRNQTLDKVIIDSLRSLVDRYIEDERLRLTIEYTEDLDLIDRDVCYRAADKRELEDQLALVEAEIENLKADQRLLNELYRDNNYLLQNKDRLIAGSLDAVKRGIFMEDKV